MTMVIFTLSCGELVKNPDYGKKVNFASCVTGLDTGATCDLATFPASPANMMKEATYCCGLPLAFQEFGVCTTERDDSSSATTGKTRYNVPVCHSYRRAVNGKT